MTEVTDGSNHRRPPRTEGEIQDRNAMIKNLEEDPQATSVAPTPAPSPTPTPRPRQ